MTDDLAALLTAELDSLEATVADADAPDDVVLDMSTSQSFICSFLATILEPEPGTAGPVIVAQADIDPGGRIADASVEARDGDRTITRDVESGTPLHRALAILFEDFWSSWDEVPEGTPGEVLGVRVSNLLPGGLMRG